EPLDEAAAGEKHDQQDGEEEAGDGVAHDDDGARPHVERRAVADGFGDAEGNRHEVDQERRPEAERDGHGEPIADQLDDGRVTEEAMTEVEPCIALYHLEEADVGGLVEAVELLDLADELRVAPARAPVLAVAGSRLTLAGAGAPAGGFATGRAQ